MTLYEVYLLKIYCHKSFLGLGECTGIDCSHNSVARFIHTYILSIVCTYLHPNICNMSVSFPITDFSMKTC